MKLSRTYSLCETFWPKRVSEFDRPLYETIQWGKVRRRFLDIAFTLYVLAEDGHTEASDSIQSDMLFLASIASIREIIG